MACAGLGFAPVGASALAGDTTTPAPDALRTGRAGGLEGLYSGARLMKRSLEKASRRPKQYHAAGTCAQHGIILAMPWIDSHCHLDAPEFDADRDAVVQRARAAGLAMLVLPAVAVAG